MVQDPIESTSIPEESAGDWAKYSPKYRVVADYLGVDVNTEWSRAKPKLDYLIDWASKAVDSKDPEKVISALDELNAFVGPASWDEKKVSHLYKALKLNTQIDLQKEIYLKSMSKKAENSVSELLRSIVNKVGSWRN